MMSHAPRSSASICETTVTSSPSTRSSASRVNAERADTPSLPSTRTPTESGGPPKSPEPTPGPAARVDQRVANVQLVCSSGVFRSSDVLDTGVVRVSGGSHPAPLHFPPLAPPTTLQVAQIGVSSAFPTIEPPCRTTAAGLTGSPRPDGRWLDNACSDSYFQELAANRTR